MLKPFFSFVPKREKAIFTDGLYKQDHLKFTYWDPLKSFHLFKIIKQQSKIIDKYYYEYFVLKILINNSWQGLWNGFLTEIEADIFSGRSCLKNCVRVYWHRVFMSAGRGKTILTPKATNTLFKTQQTQYPNANNHFGNPLSCLSG